MTDQSQAAEQTEETQGGTQEGAGKQETSLDDLLSQWDQGQQREEQPSEKEAEKPSVDPERLARALSAFEERETREIRKQTADDVQAAVKTVKEHERLQSLPDVFVEGAVDRIISADERLMRAWQHRHSNPQGWKQVLGKVSEQLAGMLETQPDSQLTEDREAARASVRSTRKEADEEVTEADILKMDRTQFAKFQDRMFSENAKKRGLA